MLSVNIPTAVANEPLAPPPILGTSTSPPPAPPLRSRLRARRHAPLQPPLGLRRSSGVGGHRKLTLFGQNY